LIIAVGATHKISIFYSCKLHNDAHIAPLLFEGDDSLAFSIRRRFSRFQSETLSEFYLHIQPLLDNEQVQSMENYIQHNCYSRLSHSLDVAYYSFFIAKLLGWDSGSAARGGLLHDLYLYDRREDEESNKGHLRNHPKIALENARKICDLNKIEENIIRRHMWLITLTPPRYKEGFIVTFVDKYCALREALIGIRNRKRQALPQPEPVTQTLT